jgi:Na+-translocating ferredoxin:NAD+ oxidoreductase RnfD subunit
MSPETIAIPAKRSANSNWRKWLSIDNRFVPPLFITLILLVGHLSYGILESYQKTLLAIATSIVTELVLGRIFLGKWPHIASAYITGISVGILLRSPAYWPFAICAAIAITSKYVLRFKGKHLWNPSNFGICVMLFLATSAVATLSIQWGNDLSPLVVIWALGSLIIWRVHRIHISATYVVSFLLLALLRARLIHEPWQAEISPITGPEYQLFIFFMITDPKSTVRSRTGQCLVAFAIAVVEMFFRFGQSVYAPLYALFCVGPVAMLIEMFLDSRRVTPVANSAAMGAPSQGWPSNNVAKEAK